MRGRENIAVDQSAARETARSPRNKPVNCANTLSADVRDRFEFNLPVYA